MTRMVDDGGRPNVVMPQNGQKCSIPQEIPQDAYGADVSTADLPGLRSRATLMIDEFLPL